MQPLQNSIGITGIADSISAVHQVAVSPSSIGISEREGFYIKLERMIPYHELTKGPVF